MNGEIVHRTQKDPSRPAGDAGGSEICWKAGVSVAAVALPTAIAYVELIGFEPVVGLYAAILPLLGLALADLWNMLNPIHSNCGA